MKTLRSNKIFEYYFLLFVRQSYQEDFFNYDYFAFSKKRLYVSKQYLNEFNAFFPDNYPREIQSLDDLHSLALYADDIPDLKKLCIFLLTYLSDKNRKMAHEHPFFLKYILENESFNILKLEILFLKKVKKDLVDNKIDFLAEKIFVLDPMNIIFQLLYSRYLGRICYGKTRDINLLEKSYEVLGQAEKSNQEYREPNFTIYCWKAFLLVSESKLEEALCIIKKSENYIQNKIEYVQYYDAIILIYLKSKDYSNIINLVSSEKFNVGSFRYRTLGYIIISYIECNNLSNIEYYIGCYMNSFFQEKKYIPIFDIQDSQLVILSISNTKDYEYKIQDIVSNLGVGKVKKYEIIYIDSTKNFLSRIHERYVKNTIKGNMQFLGMHGIERYFSKLYLDLSQNEK